MEILILGRHKCPKIAKKASEALTAGFRRPIVGTFGKWQQVNVGYRYRILLKGDGLAHLLTHEQMNRYLSPRTNRTK